MEIAMIALFLALVSAISISVSPRVCFEPCTLLVKLRVPKAEENRKVVLELEADNTDYYRRSDLDWSPTSPNLTEVRYINVPEGHYFLRAYLFKSGGRSQVDAVEIEVK